FVQDAPWDEFLGPDRNKLRPLALVLALNPGRDTTDLPKVQFKECLFARGQTAVALDGAATVHADNCAFGPFGANFHLFGDSDPFATELKLTHCSALVAGGPVFRIDKARCRLTVQSSLFTHPHQGGPSQYDGYNDLIHQTESAEPLVKFVN